MVARKADIQVEITLYNSFRRIQHPRNHGPYSLPRMAALDETIPTWEPGFPKKNGGVHPLLSCKSFKYESINPRLTRLINPGSWRGYSPPNSDNLPVITCYPINSPGTEALFIACTKVRRRLNRCGLDLSRVKYALSFKYYIISYMYCIWLNYSLSLYDIKCLYIYHVLSYLVDSCVRCISPKYDRKANKKKRGRTRLVHLRRRPTAQWWTCQMIQNGPNRWEKTLSDVPWIEESKFPEGTVPLNHLFFWLSRKPCSYWGTPMTMKPQYE